MENEPKTSIFSASIKYGLATGLVLIVFSTLFYMIGSQDSVFLSLMQSFLSFVIVVLVSIFSIKTYRDKELGGFISFGNGFKLSFLTLLIAAFVVSIYATVYVTMIDSSAMDERLEQVIIDLEDSGADDTAIDMAIRFTNFFRSPIIIFLTSLIMYTIGSVIISLIGALVMKKEGFKTPEV
ncbi:MAG: DUF4199 domain-containing protein [Saprospirales bacterium]|nr:MAG: DUF4199 domain-containing protein [Saprospirales bacterium]